MTTVLVFDGETVIAEFVLDKVDAQTAADVIEHIRKEAIEPGYRVEVLVSEWKERV